MAEYFDCVSADAKFLKGEYKEAFELYFKGANDHRSSRAAFDLAYMYHRGIYVPRNYKMARDYYTYASLLDGGAPLFNLAVMCLRGQGGEVDFKKAVDYMKRADAMGCIDAQIYLGTAYMIGYVFDPIEIECISMIPFYRVIKRDVSSLCLGDGRDDVHDSSLEAERFEAIEGDEFDATEMFERASRQKDTTYIEEQVGNAKFVLGQALIEGIGEEYSPAKGYRLIEAAALENGSREAAAFLIAHNEEARAFGIDPRRVAGILSEKNG